MEELDQDRLSSLPKEILHCIMSRLPEKDVARTSVLSKTWLDTWYTFPILSFSASKFMQMSPLQPMEDSERMRNILGLEFCDYVKRRILRFWDQNLTIKEFKLKVNNSGLHHISKDVNFWLQLACECGVEVIEYSQDISVGTRDLNHVLPMCVIEAKSITKLVLEGFIKIDPTFIYLSIKCFPLRVLSLQSVLLGNKDTFNNLISLCPLIESITLRSCSVLISGVGIVEKMKSLSISGLQNLKRVDVFGIQDVFIDSSSLETLYYRCPADFNAPLKVDIDRCRNLKELWMWNMNGTFFTDKWFLEQFPKFRFLDSLKLSYCIMPKRIDISSVQLKVLELSYCSNLKEINIDAPNLLSCGYKDYGASVPIISFLRNSSKSEVNIRLSVGYVDLCNLREFVQNIKPNNVSTSLVLSISNPSNVDALNLVASHVSFTPPRIKHLTIAYVPKNKYLFSSIVNILLASCCPATISLSIYSSSKEFIELFYETLMRRKEDKCFCSFYDTKCWWHDLKDVKVTSSMKMDKNVDFKTILESLVLAPFESISFRLDF